MCYELNEARIRILTTACRHGIVVYGGRHGKTLRKLEEMGLVSVEFEIVWVRQERKYSLSTVPRCRWTVRPTKRGADLFHHLNKHNLHARADTVTSSTTEPSELILIANVLQANHPQGLASLTR